MVARGYGFGQLIAGDRPIRGLLALPEPAGAVPSITVTWRGPDTDVSDRGAPPIWSRADDALDFSPPGVAQYRCTARTIAVTPAPAADLDTVEALLVATALPAVLWLQGRFVLHAAAIVPAGAERALAIVGASGSGKSWLAAAFLARGARLVADDSLALRCDGDAVLGSGLAGGYHLAGGDAEARRFHRVSVASACVSARIGAIVILADDAPCGGARLAGVEAVVALLRHRHRATVPRSIGREPQTLIDAARVARSIPVFTWHRAEGDKMLKKGVEMTRHAGGSE